MKKEPKQQGQALVEYLFVFSFVALIGVFFVRSINLAITETMGGLAYALTQELSIGVCRFYCVTNAFMN